MPEELPEPGEDTVDLVGVVRRAREGQAPPQDVFDAFLRARVYCERPEGPGFLAVPAPDGLAGQDTNPRSRLLDLIEEASEEAAPPDRLVPVFSSLDQLALFLGEGGGAWFSTTGADVLDLLPPGLDLWLDPAAEHAVRLASAAIRVEPVLHISYRNRGNVT